MRVIGNVNGPPTESTFSREDPNHLSMISLEQAQDFAIRSSVILIHLDGFMILYELYQSYLKWNAKRKFNRYQNLKS